MSLWEAFILSLVQGITEFLPISSSGHLVIVASLWDNGLSESGENLTFVLLAHLGTLIAICWIFRSSILDLLHYAGSGSLRIVSDKGWREAWLVNPKGRMIIAILISTAITGSIGLLLDDFFEALYSHPDLVGFALCFTALLLIATLFRRDTRAEQSSLNTVGFPYPFWIAIAIALAQSLAIVPGISRSGSTIALALLLNMRRSDAGEFSFLIALPVILGASLVKFSHVSPDSSSLGLGLSVLTLVVSAMSGLLSLKVLLRFIRGGQLAWFGLYCMVVGVWAILYLH